MNLDKIGKFIKRCRIKKNLTQEQLANIINVSNKSISKWENGKGLMDISLLEPLSRALDVGIIDILRGEKLDVIKQNNDEKEITKLYNEIKVKHKKRVIIFLLTFLITFIIAGIYIYNKSCYLIEFQISIPEQEIIERETKSINIEDDSKKNQNKIQLDSFLISNVVNGFSLKKEIFKSNNEDVTIYKYFKYDKNNELTDAIWITNKSYYKFLDIIENGIYSQNEKYYVPKSEIGRVLNEQKINDDLSLMRFLDKYKYTKNNIYTSKQKIRKNYILNYLKLLFNKNLTFIHGKYEGFISWYYYRGLKACDVSIYINEEKYDFTFIGDECAQISFIKDFFEKLELISEEGDN